MAIVKVCKVVRLLGIRVDMAILMICKDVTLLGKVEKWL